MSLKKADGKSRWKTLPSAFLVLPVCMQMICALTGCSSGAHLALSLAFRLKRYGYNPRGIVTVSAQTDDREMDPDILRNLEFYGKLVKARSFCELHLYGGSIHNNAVWAGIKATGELNDYSRKVADLYYNEIEYCYKYDLRRPWVKEEYKDYLRRKFDL